MRATAIRLLCLPIFAAAWTVHANEPTAAENTGAAAALSQDVQKMCDTALGSAVTTRATGDEFDFAREYKTMVRLNDLLPKLYLKSDLVKRSWYTSLTRFAIPSLVRKAPSITMVPIGDSSSGKSTWLNTTVATLSGVPHKGFEYVVPVEMESGTTRRVIAVMSEDAALGRGNAGALIQADVAERFDNPQIADTEQTLLEQGPPVIRIARTLPADCKFILGDGPDISSGSVKGEDPQFKQQVHEAVVSADVLVIMLNPQNYNNYWFKKAVREEFETYGARSTVLIWQEDAEGAEDRVAAMVRTFAQEIYQEPPTKTGMPEGVVGAYWAERKNDVLHKRAFPKYNRLSPEFLEYEDLLRQIEADPNLVKTYSVRQVLKRIQLDMRDVLERETKQIHAMQIYADALDAKIATVAQELQQRIPYEDIQARVRDQFFKLRSKGALLILHKVVNKFAHPLKKSFEEYRQSRSDSERDRRNSEAVIEHKIHDLVTSFRDGIVNLIKVAPPEDATNSRVAGTAVETLAAKYNRLFMKATDLPKRSMDTVLPPEGQGATALPPIADLPDSARLAVERMIQLDTRMLGKRLFMESSKYMDVASKTIETDQEIAAALRERVDNQVLSTHTVVDVTTGLFMFGSTVSFLSGGLANWMGIFGFGIAGQLWYRMLDTTREENLRQALLRYFGRRQFEVVRDFLTANLKFVRDELTAVNPERVEVIRQIREALSLSDQDVPEFSETIELQPDPGNPNQKQHRGMFFRYNESRDKRLPRP